MRDIVIRPALQAERSSLEALQWRASLANSGDRDALLANPDAIELPAEHIADGHVFVAQREGVIVGFAAVLTRPDGNAELDASMKAGMSARSLNENAAPMCAANRRTGTTHISLSTHRPPIRSPRPPAQRSRPSRLR
jgi:hypothetical protein